MLCQPSVSIETRHNIVLRFCLSIRKVFCKVVYILDSKNLYWYFNPAYTCETPGVCFTSLFSLCCGLETSWISHKELTQIGWMMQFWWSPSSLFSIHLGTVITVDWAKPPTADRLQSAKSLYFFTKKSFFFQTQDGQKSRFLHGTFDIHHIHRLQDVWNHGQ